jgi:repressor LexA
MTNCDIMSPNETKALRIIRNSFMTKGEPPSVRELMRGLGFTSPNSASLVIASLEERKMIDRRGGKIRLLKDPVAASASARTVDVPLVGVVSCGTPIFAEENLEAMIPVSTDLAKPGHRYFMLRASGDSMDKAGINDGDLVLVRQQPTAEPGDRVIALIDDSATIKEFRVGGNSVVLAPRSSNPNHRPIVVTGDFAVQGVVVATVPAESAA